MKIRWWSGLLARGALAALVMILAAGPLTGRAAAEDLIRVAAMGDIMLGTENLLPADGAAGAFTEVKPHLAGADLIFGNYEGSLTDRGEPTKVSQSGKSYCFRTPPEYGRVLADAGFNIMSIANNHINDYGPEGKRQTIETMEKYNIAWSGPTDTVARIMVDGVDVAMVAFHTSSHSNWVGDIPAAKQLVAGLAKTGAIVIVSFHGGAEGEKAIHVPDGPESFYGENRGDLRQFCRGVVDAGADLVIGHGPHVPRAMEVYKGRLIAYSLGNFCTGKGISVKGKTGLAPLLLVDLHPDGRLAGGKVVGFIQLFGQHPKEDSQNQAAKLMYRLGTEDFPQSYALNKDGSLIVRE